MEVELAYGKDGLRAALPDDNVVKVLKGAGAPPLDNPENAVRAALAHPVGDDCAPLAEAAGAAGNVLVVVSDITRPVPYPVLLPPLLDVLENGAGVRRDAISFLVGTGLHRPNTEAELIGMLGPHVVSNYRIDNHDARDPRAQAAIGTTSRGTKVLIDSRYMEADFRIATSLIEPHFMAGYSGGRKALFPGIAASETIGQLHGYELLAADGVEIGRLDGNPVHAELLEAALLAGCEFSVNVTMDAKRRPTSVAAGELDAAHRAACKAAEAPLLDTIDSPADVVVTSSAGFPLDATFYQSIKGVVAAAPIVEEGGTIIIAAECSEGMGSDEFGALVRGFDSPEGFLDQIRKADGFVVDQWQLQMLCKVLYRADVVLVSDCLAPDAVDTLGIGRADNIEQAVSVALERQGPDARIAVIPEGPYVLARCAGDA